jgi:hypothetical protein
MSLIYVNTTESYSTNPYKVDNIMLYNAFIDIDSKMIFLTVNLYETIKIYNQPHNMLRDTVSLYLSGNDYSNSFNYSNFINYTLGLFGLSDQQIDLPTYQYIYIPLPPPEWDSTILYNIGDTVSYSNIIYKAVESSTGETPNDTSDYWTSNFE